MTKLFVTENFVASSDDLGKTILLHTALQGGLNFERHEFRNPIAGLQEFAKFVGIAHGMNFGIVVEIGMHVFSFRLPCPDAPGILA